MRKTVMITGGQGMVGKNFCELAKTTDLRILAPRRSELDLSSYIAVEEYLKHSQPDLVIHAAGRVAGIQANIKYPLRFLTENMDIGRNIVLASHAAGVRKLINLGSSCMYPHNAKNPLHESAILTGELEPTNEGYALAKILTAKLCEYLAREYPDFQYKTLIPCNLFGRFDKFDPERSHLLPAIITKTHDALNSESKSIEIWGDGSARREFMFAGDFAQCLLRAIEMYDTLPSTMNVGLGHDYSINEYYRVVADVIGYNGSFEHDLSRPVGMAQKLVDVDALRSWGWEAKTSLQDGIATTYEYFLEKSV